MTGVVDADVPGATLANFGEVATFVAIDEFVNFCPVPDVLQTVRFQVADNQFGFDIATGTGVDSSVGEDDGFHVQEFASAALVGFGTRGQADALQGAVADFASPGIVFHIVSFHANQSLVFPSPELFPEFAVEVISRTAEGDGEAGCRLGLLFGFDEGGNVATNEIEVVYAHEGFVGGAIESAPGDEDGEAIAVL